jgi:hypothetical protein
LNAKHSLPLNLSSLLYNIQHLRISQNVEQRRAASNKGLSR